MASFDIDQLENGDISEVIGDVAIDNDQFNETSIEELETIFNIDTCPICKEDKASTKQHLISCTKCNQKYHTICLKKDPIPYNSLSSMERRKRDEYVSSISFLWIEYSILNCRLKRIMESGFVTAAERREFHLPPPVLNHRCILRVLDLLRHQCLRNVFLAMVVSLERLLMLSHLKVLLGKTELPICQVL